MMSGVMIKLGIYGLIRIGFEWLGPGPAWWGVLILIVGAISALLGVLYALIDSDLKRRQEDCPGDAGRCGYHRDQVRRGQGYDLGPACVQHAATVTRPGPANRAMTSHFASRNFWKQPMTGSVAPRK